MGQNEDFETWMINEVRELLQDDQVKITMETQFSELPLNSYDALALITKLNEYTGHEFDLSLIWDHPRLGDCIKFINTQRKN